MADRQFLRLNDDWALAFDNRQWVIQRRHGAEGWSGRKFIGTSVADLRCAIAALKIRVSRAAALELDRLPATFGAFLEQQGVDRPREQSSVPIWLRAGVARRSSTTSTTPSRRSSSTS